MNKDQEAIISEFEKIRDSANTVLKIVRVGKPLNHRNSAAIRTEMNDILRHMKRDIARVEKNQEDD